MTTQAIEIRDFEIRSTDLELREVSGIAVPYNETIDLGGGMSERFAQGAVDITNQNVKLLRDHDKKQVIGRIVEMRDETEGLFIRAKISETALGNETLALVKDGAIRSFSVGFIPVKDEKQDRTVIRTKVNLKEVSLVPFPAYETASVTEVREIKEEIKMTENNNTVDYTASIDEVRSSIEGLERKFEVINSNLILPSAETTPQFRSYGEYVKSVASNDEAAIKLNRDFTGGAMGDSILKNAWVSDAVRILNNGRPTYNVFSSAPLPADGMTIEYPVLESDTTDYAEQEAEGDTLAYGKIAITSATAPIKTYGGYTDMSRQVIERSSVAYVDTAFRAMAATYARKTNAVVKAQLATSAGLFATSTVSAWTADEVIEMLADSATKVNNETGRALEFILCSSDVFAALAKQVDGLNRPIAAATAVSNGFGNINPIGLTGSILGLPIVVDPSLSAGTLYVGNGAALTTYESAGAPFRLNDEEITTLTKSFSVYGYLGVAVPDPKALVKVANPLD
jgi:HK97 family phage prohead protease